ncbi:MAG: translation initiation factor [Thermoleophilales bacterium]|jgi:translation initiation factor IF-2|nr:translation initiation factor [Thermoleophilales bacterium]
MAKKRVHEIAKERGVSSKDVIATLQKAGLDVKAAASSVDEDDVARAFNGGTAAPAEAKPKQQQRAPQTTGGQGFAAIPQGGAPPRPRPTNQPDKPAQQRAPQAGDAKGGGDRQRPAAGDGAGAAAGGAAGGDGAARPARPQRAAPGRTGSSGRRRVVIDSQAARRPPGGPPQQQQPPRRGRGRRRRTPWVEPDFSQPEEVKEELPTKVNSGATVKEVGESLGLGAPEVIKKLMELGEMATLTQTLTDEAIEVLADAFEKKITIVSAADDVEEVEETYEDADDVLVERPPVITVMGHVDHGKTSLLDAVRETEVAAGEAGGITQHIGAYQVHHGDHLITFLDTPGHQAFTAMRARGAKVTDIAVIVVAADDGVMPQTREAIDHARAAEVPILVAVNKIDKEGADPNRVRGELAQMGLTPADWGGDTEFVDVSAKTRDGLDDLLENLVTLSELQELKANPGAEASGTVIESKLDPGRGPVVSMLVMRGTLNVGDALVAGAHWGRVRAMNDHRGDRIKQATPGQPVEILGFDGVPEAGEHVRVVSNEREARSLAGDRAHRLKTEALARRQGVKLSLEDVFARAQQGDLAELALVVKSDVAGSLEALADEVARLPQEEVKVSLVREGVGGITEDDVMLASASDAVIIGFNVRPVGEARQVADREGVEIRTYSVIYKVVEELRDAMQGLLAPEEVEETVGTAEVRQIFRASKIGTIAGSHVTDGVIRRGAPVRIVRDGRIIYTARIGTLRRFQDDVREVAAGFECGITIEGYADIKEGDVFEAFETRQVEREL